MLKFLKIFLGIAALWGGGFCWFIYDINNLPNAVPLGTDGIVVLTGGKGRVEVGLQLLKLQKAKRLLISGVHENVKTRELLTEENQGLLRRIDLGYMATNTVENALEARLWALKHEIKSLCLVTADYHLRRALLEFKIHLKEVEIYPQAVRLTQLSKLNSDGGLRLVREFNKFLASGLRFIVYQLYALKNK